MNVKKLLGALILLTILVPASFYMAYRYTSFNFLVFVMDGPYCYSGRCGMSDTEGREQVACDSLPANTQVWLTAGQSNSANYGQALIEAGGGVYNLNPSDGQCYRARDPLLGPDGKGGAVWTQLADKVIAGGHADAVLIAAVGVGGTPIYRWRPDGDLYSRMVGALAGLEAANLPPTHFFWHQGEANNRRNTSYEDYRADFELTLSALRKAGMNAPVMLAQASRCKGETDRFYEPVRSAQRDIAANDPMIFAGPDTDVLFSEEMRHDLCHFSSIGMPLHAQAWYDALLTAGML